jgi:hypothetical protein
MLLKVLPNETYVTILVFTVILLIIRIIFRVFYIKEQRKNQTGG